MAGPAGADVRRARERGEAGIAEAPPFGGRRGLAFASQPCGGTGSRGRRTIRRGEWIVPGFSVLGVFGGVGDGVAGGGGARSRLWLEIVASALGLPLELTESEEGSAYGAALLAGVAGGVFADVHDAVDRCVRVTDVVEPNPGWRDHYAEVGVRYRALYPALHRRAS